MNYVLAVTISTVFLKKCIADYTAQSRIVGGTMANISDYPFQVCLILKTDGGRKVTEFRGSAVIVSIRWAFTSANNIAYIDLKLIQVGLVYLRGNVSKWNDKLHCNDHKIIETYMHPKYKTYSRDYNLALVKVQEAFKGFYEKPIRVAGKHYKYKDNLAVTVVGWGKTFVGRKGPTDVLRYATVGLLNQHQCDKLYSTGFKSPLTQRMVCANKTSRDPCTYDSGGPLIYGRDLLLAIIAWSRGCAESMFPEIYTKVSEFYDWLKSFEKKNKVSLNINYVDS